MASRGLGSLTLDLIAKIGGFSGPLSQAERDLDRKSRAMQRRAKEMGEAIGGSFRNAAVGIAGFVAGFVSVQAVFAGFKGAIDAADKLNDFNIRLGVSAEALSGWSYAAKQSGTDIDALGVGLKQLSKSMAEALDPKSKSATVFEAIGVQVKDAHGNLRSLESVLPEVADAFKKLDNETLETALAMEVFGKSGTDLLEFLNQGGDGLDAMRERAAELGIVLSQDTLQAADAFNDTLGDLQAATQGLFTQIAANLLPELIELLQRMVAFASDGQRVKEVSDGIASVFETVATITGLVSEKFAAFSEILRGSVGNFVALTEVARGYIGLDWNRIATGLQLSRDASKQSVNGLANLLSGRNAARASAAPPHPGVDFSLGAPLTPAEQSAFERRVTGAFGGKPSGGAKKTGKSDAEKEAERLKAAYDRMNESLAQQIALFGQDGEAAKVRYEVEHGELQKLTQAQKDALIVQAEKLDMMRAEQDVQKELDAVNKRREESVKTLLEDIAHEQELLGKTVEQQEILNNLRYAGVDANSEYGQSIIEATQALQQNREATETQIELMDEFRAGLGDALVDIATGAKSAKEAFADFFDDLARRITRMIIERWIERAFGQMGSTSSGAMGSGGASSGFDWGALIGAFFGGGKAVGGRTSAGMFYEVNENGPELLSVAGHDYLMMGNRMGMVTPTDRIGGGGNTYNLHQIFPTNGVATRRTREQQAREAARQGMTAIRRTSGK